ncbi:MAG: AarF/UbiB family protein [Desulfobacter sp.]
MEYLRILIILLTHLPGYVFFRLFNPKRLPGFVNTVITRLGPVYIKFIQILSTRAKDIPDDYIQSFAKLRDDVPVKNKDKMYALVKSHFGPEFDTIFSSFPEQPIASGSVAVVYRAVLREHQRDVAVKVLRPGIRKLIKANFKFLLLVVNACELISAKARFINLKGVTEEIRELLLSQTDLRKEENNYRNFDEQFSDDDSVVVPETFPQYSSAQILVMEFVDGIPPYEFERLNQDVKVLARRVDYFLDSMIFLKGMCHADLHPGNFFWNQKGQLVLIDFGLVFNVPVMTRNHLMTFYFSIAEGYYDFATKYFLTYFASSAGGSDAVDQELYDSINGVIHEHFVASGGNPTFSEFCPKLMSILSKKNIRMETYHNKLLLTIVTIEGFLYSIDPEFDMMENARRKRLLSAEYASISKEAEELVLGKFGTYSTAKFNNDSSPEKAWHERDHFVLDAIDAKKGDFIIDVGCGRGSLLQKMEQRGADCIGITISKIEQDSCLEKGLKVAWTSWEEFERSCGDKYPKADAMTAVEMLLHLGTLHENKVGLTDIRLAQFFDWSQRQLVDRGKLFLQALTIDPAFLFEERYARMYDRITNLLPWIGFVTLDQIRQKSSPYFTIVESRNDASDLLPTYEFWRKNVDAHYDYLRTFTKKTMLKYLIDELDIFIELSRKNILTLHRIVLEKNPGCTESHQAAFSPGPFNYKEESDSLVPQVGGEERTEPARESPEDLSVPPGLIPT